MSNVIKAYSVRYDENEKKYIDTKQKEVTLDSKVRQDVKNEDPDSGNEGFVEGLKAIVVEPKEEEENYKLKANTLIAEAKKEAENIIGQANKEAQRIKDETLAAARKKGYEEGLQKAQKELQKLEAEYSKKIQRLEEERENMINELQPQIAEIIAGLVEKITGIVIEDKNSVILYLVEKVIKNTDRSNEFKIKVSGDDYEFLASRKEELLQAIGRKVEIYITADTGLQKNQCLIETDNRVINCSLDTQLNNLITDIKSIGGI